VSTQKRQEHTPGHPVVGHQVASQRREMLGNIAAVEKPLYKEGPTPRRSRRERGAIAVRVSFEAHRLAPTYLTTAYEHLVPLRRHGVRAATGAAPDHTDHRPVERAGA
jgi:hypothetical protein